MPRFFAALGIIALTTSPILAANESYPVAEREFQMVASEESRVVGCYDKQLIVTLINKAGHGPLGLYSAFNQYTRKAAAKECLDPMLSAYIIPHSQVFSFSLAIPKRGRMTFYLLESTLVSDTRTVYVILGQPLRSPATASPEEIASP